MITQEALALSLGFDVIEGMRQIENIEVPEGYDVSDYSMVYEFGETSPMPGKWKVSVQKVEE